MRAIFIDIQRPLESKLLDPVTSQSLGGMVTSLNIKLDKPRREFNVRSWDTLLHQQMELLRNEIHSGRANGVYWLDGEKYGFIEEPMFVANGNSVQKQFQLPVNNVFPSSCKFWDNQTLKTDWTINSEPAIVTFTSAPTGRITFIGKRKFRVIQKVENDVLLAESQLFSNTTDGVYTAEPINFIEVEAVDIA
jgi:hypothetical protein